MQILLSTMIKSIYNEVKSYSTQLQYAANSGQLSGELQKQISSSLRPLKPRVVEHREDHLHWEPAPP